MSGCTELTCPQHGPANRATLEVAEAPRRPHYMTVERVHGEVDRITFRCNAQPGTECKLWPACECEYWGEHFLEPWDPKNPRAVRTPLPGHESVSQEDCWMLPWFDAMDTLDHLEYGLFVGAAEDGSDLQVHDHQDRLWSGPCELVWSGEDEYYFTTEMRGEDE